MAATYVYSLTVASMRKAAMMLGVKQSLPRAQMRGLLFAAAAAKVHCGDGGWLDVLGDDCKSCITNQTNPWRVAPTDAELAKWKQMEATDGRRRKARIIDATAVEQSSNGDVEAGCTQEPSFTLSEFGRLVCVLLQVDNVRQDLVRSGVDLARAQVDRREGRDDFWALSVETAFHDPGVNVSLAATGHLADVDVNAPPRAKRAGNKRKTAFFKARSVFTTAHTRWSLSGQMDPEKFVDFLPTAPRSTDISAEGKRAHILFIALRCGTLDEDVDALNFSKKTAPKGVAYDDLNLSSSDGDRRNITRRVTKRARMSKVKESDMREQGLQIGEIIGVTMQPLIAAVRDLTERETIPTVISSAANSVLEDRQQELLVRQFDEVATRLEDIDQRTLANRSRPSDNYYKLQLERRMTKLKEQLDSV
jgi:hypothetical protein